MRTLRAVATHHKLPNPDPLSEGLVAHWKLDEGAGAQAYDVRSGNTGSVYNSAWVPGISGNAVDFNGLTSHIDVPRSDSLEPVSAISISCWLYLHSFTPASYPSMVYKGHTLDPAQGSSYCLAVGYMAPNPCFFVSTTSVWGNPLWTSKTLDYLRWYHVVATYDGAKQKIYVDGEFIQDASLTGAIKYDSNLLTLGMRGSWVIDGVIDSIRIYNRALAPGDVERLYASKS